MKISTLFIILNLWCFNVYSQNTTHSIYAKTAYNKIGFYNELGYQFQIKNHNLSLGLKHYSLDYFFEKNTIGASFGYGYNVESASNKVYFSPEIHLSFFKEAKTNSDLTLMDLNLINTIGYQLTQQFSLNYQVGFGVIKAISTNSINNYKADFFNYEMAIGLRYTFG